MAAKRGKSQAKRNGGNDSTLPGWAWMVLGILMAVVVILVAPKYLKSNGDGFFRPQPNPDAQPAPVASSEDEGVVSDDGAGEEAPAKRDNKTAAKKDTDYDFYTLLPGKEVPMSDAELAASERAEAQRQAAAQPKPKPEPAAAEPATTAALPKPVEQAAGNEPAAGDAAATAQAKPAKPAAPVAAETPAVDDGTRYLLQAGAFQASGQAEEMKAKIAMLGLGARVESADIGGKTVYRVRMGPYGTASDLADAKRKLSGGGLSAMAIKVK